MRDRFAEYRGRVAARTALPWGEHCTECNAPSCYSSCDLYTPRADAGCRLFVEGMVRVDEDASANGYLLKAQFKRWGKLWTVGNVHLLAPDAVARREEINRLVGAFARTVPLPADLKRRTLIKISYLRRRSAEEARPGACLPDWFVAEIFNPNGEAIELTLVMRPTVGGTARPFQRLIRVAPGFTRERVPFADIAACIDPAAAFGIELVPNQCENKVLYFGLLDFVQETPAAAVPAPAAPATDRKWKCIVWDLDNTLWQGVLLEDGADNVRLRKRAVEVIEETDRRGILHSIASKNNPEPVLELLAQWGIRDYFLCPQIGWRPKSESLARIARELNIGVDTLAFVDDQPFERAEVASALPTVAVLDAADLAGIPDRPECRVTVTEESRQRRSMYQQQIQRVAAQESHGGDYKEFLRSCRIALQLAPLAEASVDRVYELAQRTNQMNFSGSRYPRPELARLAQSTLHETFVIRCEDRFGAYGIVGFAVVELAGPRLLDLMFSCRVQAKRVEHAVLSHLLKRYVSQGGRDFFANYRRTPKNAESGRVFEELGFTVAGEADGLTSLVFRNTQPVPDDGIITITAAEAA
ncbi:HAD-IIIC family phosphatase [Verrucomicrobiales bacterium]|nr:HAD-IIIC family phosphatase [Verrucomicrobiales bacterium]